MRAGFRVRAPHWDEVVSPEELEERDRYYREEFLPAKRQHVYPALWEYFFYDSFHDGHITDMQFEALRCNLTFNLSCPNVKFHHDKKFRFVNVDYRVVLNDVEYLTIERRDGNPAVNIPGVTFGYAEIETCEEEIAGAARRTGDRYHSLIIETELFNLMAVFSYIGVEAKEPVATELMRRDPRYEFPFVPW
jgi:hypothetical protein